MPRIARTVAVVTCVMTPWLANAEPMMLTATQMESITAAGPPTGININVQTNINVTTQVATAIATAIATCGICVGGGPTASSLAAAANANVSGQFQR